jgi:hypothetical protein
MMVDTILILEYKCNDTLVTCDTDVIQRVYFPLFDA